MPIQGNIEEAGLPDVLQLLALGRKTGCLFLEDGATHGEIYLDAGRISFATVANRLDRLGEVLVKCGRITPEQLKAATEEQSRGDKRQLGMVLVESGRIDRAELERFVELQVEEAVYFLFTWKQGTFQFTTDRRPPHAPLPVALNAEGLLLEGARRVDEWTLIQKKVPAFDLVYRRTKDKLNEPVAQELTYPQQRILPLLDGTRDAHGLVDVTGMSEFDVGKALYGLVTAGLAQLVERRAHVRHLEYRELLAYVVREAEFADPQRRKEAGRHIVDCPKCADRLRTIQVRRTEGSGTFTAASVDSEPPVKASSVVRLERPAAAIERPAAVIERPAAAIERPAATIERPAATPVEPQRPERRGTDRRAGRDRRQFERRAGLDRRLEVNASWGQTYEERRMGPRRADDWSGLQLRGRRTGDAGRRGSAAVPPAGGGGSRSAGPGQRFTEPRLHSPLERRGRGPLLPVTATPDDWETADAPLAEAEAEAASEHKAEGLQPVPATRQAPPKEDRRAKRAATEPGAGAEAGLEWLVSPEESVEMIRASRSLVPPLQAGSRAAAGPGAGTAPKPAAAPASGPVVHVPRLEPSRRSPITTSSVPASPSPFGVGVDGDWSPAGKSVPVSWLIIAAALVGVALLGYRAGQRGVRGSPQQAAESTAASGIALSTEAQSPPDARARASEARTTRPANPVQSATRSGASPAAGARPRPAAGSAPQRPAPVAQRASPPPVVAAAQPPAAQPPAPQAAAKVEAPAPAPPPTVGVLRGAVHDASGKALAGARVSVRGTALSAVTDGSGAYVIQGVPDGQVVVQAAADGYVAGSADARAKAGATVSTDVTLSRAATAGEPDRELAAGGWTPSDRATAISLLGGTLGAIDGLTIESVTQSTSGTRARVRVAQLTESGERIALTETRAGAAVRGAGPAVVTALRVMPPSEAYPFSTGTVSLGNILITVKTTLAPDVLRSLLAKLGDVAQGH